jgi:hypothetical protein
MTYDDGGNGDDDNDDDGGDDDDVYRDKLQQKIETIFHIDQPKRHKYKNKS